MSMARFHIAPFVVLTVSLAVLAGAPIARAEVRQASLQLPGSWYAITAAYRYEEADRFHRGWHRGADARAAGSRVRAVTGGVVRFAGDVAGRRVVTVLDADTGIVVTYVGLDMVERRAGDHVRVGDELGSADSLHVGAYDAARRSHYLPVVQAMHPLPRSEGSAAHATLSGAVVDRLEQAVRGVATPGGAKVSDPLAAVRVTDVSGARGGVRARTGSGGGLDPAAASIELLVVRPGPTGRTRGAGAAVDEVDRADGARAPVIGTSRLHAGDRPHPADGLPTFGPPASGLPSVVVSARHTRHERARSAHDEVDGASASHHASAHDDSDHGARRRAESSPARGRDSQPVAGAGVVPLRGGGPPTMPVLGSRAPAPSGSTVAQLVVIDDGRSVATTSGVRARHHGAWTSTWTLLAAVLLAVMLVFVLAWRRRARAASTVEFAAPVVEPSPPLLPVHRTIDRERAARRAAIACSEDPTSGTRTQPLEHA